MKTNAATSAELAMIEVSPMRSKFCLFVIGLLVAAPVLAARPVKQPAPAVPVIVDAVGTVVGPVVPVADSTMALAAVYRSNGDRIKILFDAFTSSAGTGSPTNLEISAISTLRIRGPVELWFPNVTDCSGTGYVQDTDLLEPVGDSFIWKSVITKEYKGYSPLFVYPKGPQSTSARPILARVNWSEPTYAPGVFASRLTVGGLCRYDAIPTSAAGTLFPVAFEGELNFTGPYTVE